MAASRLPKPGSKLGPCRKACKHIDCAQTRAMAARPCAICETPIQYERRFYSHSGIDELTHAECLEDQIDAHA